MAAPTTNKSTDSEKTVKDVFDSMTEEQKNVVYFMIGTALEEAGVDDTGAPANGEMAQYDMSDFITHEEAFNMSRNVFEMAQALQNEEPSLAHSGTTLSHSDVEEIVADARKIGSFKEAFLEQAYKFLFSDLEFAQDFAELVKQLNEQIPNLRVLLHQRDAAIAAERFCPLLQRALQFNFR